MKKFLILSVIASLALADSQISDSSQNPESKGEASLESSSDSKATQAPAPKKESIFKQSLKDTKVEGFAFMRYFGNFGNDASGYSQQYRLKLDVTTGQIKGYSLTGGIFFSQGSSTPDKGNSTHGSVQGSRGISSSGNFSDRFNISVFYASKEFKFEHSKLSFNAGRMNLKSPMNDKALDLGIGGEASYKFSKLQVDLGYYDSWISDNMAYNLRRRTTSTVTTNYFGAGDIGVGNNLIVLGVKMAKDKDGKEQTFGGFGFSAYAANAHQFVDYMVFAEGSYKVGKTGLAIKAQVVATGINSSPENFQTGSRGSTVNGVPLGWASKYDYASNRGIYNINLSYKIGGFSSKIGYLGSFGDGYGVIFDSKGGLDIGGKVWNGYFTATYEGFGILGAGSKSGTDIQVAYLTLAYQFKNSIKIGLDTTYIGGNNNMPLLNSARAKNGTSTYANLSESRRFKNLEFVEIAPSISYQFLKNFEISVFAATMVGGLELVKTRAEVKYTF